MVFEWVTEKFKQRKLQKALIKECGDDMVITSGLSILNPTSRIMFKDLPFYDTETDSIDFKELEQYICNLRIWRGAHFNKECKECFYQQCTNEHLDRLQEIPAYEHNLKCEDMDYHARTELEHLRELFEILTGEDDYCYATDFNNLKQVVKDYRTQYRDIDEIISNFENKIYEKNNEIERLQTKLNEKPSETKEIVKVIEKCQLPQDNRPIKRGSVIYNKFRLSVLKRDKVCQCCGATENLHVHHLSSFKLHNSRGADVDNGIVLCEDCHKKYHLIYGKSHKNNPVNFSKFLREYGKPLQINLDYHVEEEMCVLDKIGGK